MKALNIVTLALVIIGGLNWGLFGLAGIDLVAALFHGPTAAISRVVYVIVGLSALWQLAPFFRAITTGEIPAEADRRLR